MQPPRLKQVALEEISRTVSEVELLKQIRPPLTEQQKTALVLELDALNLTKGELQDMAARVKVRQTFGTIAIEHWIAEMPERPIQRNMIDCAKCGTRHKNWQPCPFPPPRPPAIDEPRF